MGLGTIREVSTEDVKGCLVETLRVIKQTLDEEAHARLEIAARLELTSPFSRPSTPWMTVDWPASTHLKASWIASRMGTGR